MNLKHRGKTLLREYEYNIIIEDLGSLGEKHTNFTHLLLWICQSNSVKYVDAMSKLSNSLLLQKEPVTQSSDRMLFSNINKLLEPLV